MKNQIEHKIEMGKQLGIYLQIQKGQKYYWYSYAIQKKQNIYYVYEYEIAEENMAKEVFEYETVSKFSSLEDVINHFPHKYGICFDDIHTLKGQRIFNVDFYI